MTTPDTPTPSHIVDANKMVPTPRTNLATYNGYEYLHDECAKLEAENAGLLEIVRDAMIVAVGSSDSSASGPSHCKLCGEWPARQTSKGLRCHLCECRDICADNPVPLPEGRECLQDLASIGVPGAAEKLALLPNDAHQPTRRTDV